MRLFLLFFKPFVPLVIGLFVLVFLLMYEVKMLVDVVENPKLSTLGKILWSIAMVPFLPLTAAAYYLTFHTHHHTPHYT